MQQVDSAKAIAAALTRSGVPEVDTSPLARALYSSDASLYRVPPLAVVRPRSVDELIATVEVARTAAVPVTMRGAGTSIAGNAIGPGIVVDVARHLNRIHEVDPEARTAIVDPGVVQARLQRELAPWGLRYGPDPSTHTRCTIGGMIGNNACGHRALGYGRASDNIAGLDVITGTGDRLRLAGGEVASAQLERLRELVGAQLEPIRMQFGTFSRQVSGYSLEHLLPERGFDVASFLAGSEGTLAVTLGAEVKLVADPRHRHLLVLGFDTMPEAADLVPELLEFSPVACEGLGIRIVDVFRAAHGGAAVPELPRGGGLLFVEFAGDDQQELVATASRAVASLGLTAYRHVGDAAEQAALWRVREEGAGLASRVWERPALSGWEDAAVPPARLGAYLRDFEALLEQHEVHGEPFGHFGDGCVHVRIDFPLDAEGGRSVFRSFLEDAADLVARHGGSLSGEHGDGRARSELLPRMYSDEALELFAQVKRIFDPDGVLNPGVLVDPAPVDADLRGLGTGRHRPTTALRLVHDDGDFGDAVHRCTGVGKCVAASVSAGVMCPSFQATRDEKDSTRGRARVLQEMLDGRLVEGGYAAPEVHEALDLCLSCKGCARDCPTGIDMASYKSVVLHETYRGRLRPRSHYSLGRLPRWARIIAPVAVLANLALRVPGIKHMARWVAGVDQRRSLPAFVRRPFSRAQESPQAPGWRGTVVVWADSFTEYFSTRAGHAAVALLRRIGFDVEVVARPECCGLTWISTGQLDTARTLVTRTIAQLHEYVDRGLPVVALEPSCLTVLRSDALELTDDPRALDLSKGVFTLAEFLASVPDWDPPDLAGRTIVVQPHCHQASIIGFAPDLALLGRTGASVVSLPGCCGLAGNFGVEKGHYETSVAVFEQHLLPAVRKAPEDALVLADGFSCRTQLDDLADVRALHLAELLAGGVTLDRTNERPLV